MSEQLSTTTDTDRAAAAPSNPDTLGGPRPDPTTTASKDPEHWVTGDVPAREAADDRSAAQILDTLAR